MMQNEIDMFGRKGGGRPVDASPFAQPDRHSARPLSVFRIIAIILLPLVIFITIAESGVFRPQNEAPAQPIDFSHKIHAGTYRISCLYCHTNARRSPVAGVPSVQRCMGCHKITAADRPEVRKLKGYWDRKEPIPWIKIFGQPDFVAFSHVAHVRAHVACEDCHGPVQKMDRVHRAVDLTMDRCLSCHRDRQASIDCVTCHR
ncbi:MAG: cytochrome c3 family protein [Candidatus Methylomirabilis oxyfera]|nr:cytochrome c3 family protein [Candidatus Methylomirabilis oxyfera]